jgi:hypothetical protein
MFSYVAPIEASASTAITGVITQRALPVTERRTWRNIQVVSASISGGHPQFTALAAVDPGVQTFTRLPCGASMVVMYLHDARRWTGSAGHGILTA